MRAHRALLLACTLLPFYVSRTAAAGPLLFDNGSPNFLNGAYLGGLSVPSRRPADDFEVTGGAWSLESVVLETLSIPGFEVDDVEVTIYDIADGSPGDALFSFTSVGILGTVKGMLPPPLSDLDIRTLTVDLQGVTLQPGSYFLGLFAPGPQGNTDSFFWVTTGANSTLPAQSSPDLGVSWETNSDPVLHQLNFQLFGERVAPIPEPATIALLSVGIAGVGLALRRRE